MTESASAHHQHQHNQRVAAAHAILHCSIGCILGETLGLILGTTFGFTQLTSMIVSTMLAYVIGFSLAVFPLMSRTGMNLRSAFAAICVMGAVMNAIDYHMGGMRTDSITNLRFWIALAVATGIAFVVAWPVNAWLIAKELRKHH